MFIYINMFAQIVPGWMNRLKGSLEIASLARTFQTITPTGEKVGACRYSFYPGKKVNLKEL